MLSARGPCVGQRHGLRRAGGVHILIAEGQAGWQEAHAGCHARAGEGYGLRAAGGVIRDRNRAGLAAGGRGRECHTDGAVGRPPRRMCRKWWSERSLRSARCW